MANDLRTAAQRALEWLEENESRIAMECSYAELTAIAADLRDALASPAPGASNDYRKGDDYLEPHADHKTFGIDVRIAKPQIGQSEWHGNKVIVYGDEALRDRILAALAVQLREEVERDNCELCLGSKGGVRGNENRIRGIVVCDYCTARLLRAGIDCSPQSEPVRPRECGGVLPDNELLAERDRFIVSKGLWADFCASLPAPTQEG